MKRLRVGVVGVGHLGQHHARILSAMPGVELVAVADARADQAQAVAARCGTTFLSDFRAMLDLVDAVTIAVPTVLHREVASPFLLRGIATLVEKPMAATAAESEQIVEDARAGGAVLQVGHIERFNPALRALEQLPIRPKYVSAERLSTYTFRSTDIGVVLDLMIHDLDLLLSLITAPVRSVAAVGVSLFGDHEDVANARIEFEDGSVANLTASRASYTPTRKMRIWGAEGYASLDFARQECHSGSPVRTTETRPARPRRHRPEPGASRSRASLRQSSASRQGRARAPRAPRAGAGRLRQCRATPFAAQGQRRGRPPGRSAR